MAVIEEPIATTNDDGYYSLYSGTWDNTRVVQDLYFGLPYAYFAGLRFRNIAVPQGASITSAALTLIPASVAGSGPRGLFFGYDHDDAPAWGAVHPGNMAQTTASVVGSDADPSVHDVTAIVQEIVDRVGFAGDAVSFGGDASDPFPSIRWFDYSGVDPSKAAVLDIEYVDGGGGAAPARGPLTRSKLLVSTLNRSRLLQ